MNRKSSNERIYSLVKSLKLTKAQIDRISQLDNKNSNDINEFRQITNTSNVDKTASAYMRLIKQANNKFFYNPGKSDVKFLKRKGVLINENLSNDLQIALNNQQNLLKRLKQNVVSVQRLKKQKTISSNNFNDYLSLFTKNVVHTTHNYKKVDFYVSDYSEIKQIYNLISINFSNQFFQQFLRLNLILQEMRITILYYDINNVENGFGTTYYNISDFQRCLNIIDSFIQETISQEEYYSGTNKIQSFKLFTIYYR